MNILALDSSGGETGFAALSLDNNTGAVQILAIAVMPAARELSRGIIAALGRVLERAEWSLEDVDLLAAGLGPGSWTGLRIGLTTAKTLAQTREWALAGVPTFDAIAQSVWRRSQMQDATEDEELPEHGLLLVAAPCRPGEVYGKIFECHPDFLSVVQSEWIGSPESMIGAAGAEMLSREIDAPLALAGPGAAALGAFMEENGEDYIIFEVPTESMVVEVGLAGAAAFEGDETEDPLTLQPLYLAPSAAERNLSGQL